MTDFSTSFIHRETFFLNVHLDMPKTITFNFNYWEPAIFWHLVSILGRWNVTYGAFGIE